MGSPTITETVGFINERIVNTVSLVPYEHMWNHAPDRKKMVDEVNINPLSARRIFIALPSFCFYVVEVKELLNTVQYNATGITINTTQNTNSSMQPIRYTYREIKKKFLGSKYVFKNDYRASAYLQCNNRYPNAPEKTAKAFAHLIGLLGGGKKELF